MILAIWLSILSLALPGLKAAEYLENGADWPTTQTNTACNGNQQSPINIITSSASCDVSAYLKADFFSSITATVSDNGETVKAAPTPSTGFDTMTATDVNGNIYGYYAINFHFHAPSEHTINGVQYDLELHIVHAMLSQYQTIGSTSRNLSVIGILFKLDNTAADNPLLAALNLDSVTQSTTQSVTLDMKTLVGNYLPSPLTYYKYAGSLTTPPCSEWVNWYVVSTPLKINSNQLNKLTSRWAGNSTFAEGKGNNRVTQALNGRTVKLGGATCSAENVVSVLSILILSILAFYN